MQGRSFLTFLPGRAKVEFGFHIARKSKKCEAALHTGDGDARLLLFLGWGNNGVWEGAILEDEL
jgi:hypothetical protein